MSLTPTLFQSHLTATLLTSILAAVLGSLQIGYHTGNINAPARVSRLWLTDTDTNSLVSQFLIFTVFKFRYFHCILAFKSFSRSI